MLIGYPTAHFEKMGYEFTHTESLLTLASLGTLLIPSMSFRFPFSRRSDSVPFTVRTWR